MESLGSMVNTINGNALNTILGNSVGSLTSTFGTNNIIGALSNNITQSLGEALKAAINSNEMIPTSLKDASSRVIDRTVSNNTATVSAGAQAAVDAAAGDELYQAAAEMVNEAASEADSKSESSGKKGSGNWLVNLAEALGEVQAKLAGRIADLAENMESSFEDKEGFFTAQAELTATNQMFSMASNQASTALKTIGEGLSTMARKQ